MAYAVQADLLQRVTLQELIHLTNDDRLSSEVNVTIMQGALDEGSAAVDSYCRARYRVPLQTSTDVVRIVRDVAIYELFSRRPQKMPETVRQRYEDVMGLLKDISAGKASLDQPAGVTTPQVATGSAVLPRHNGERFTERNIEGYI